MTPYYEHGGITIYHGDCREALDVCSGIAAVVTDPPYGHGEKWSGGTWADNPIYALAFKWDAKAVEDALITRVIASAPASIVWGGNYYSLPPSRSWLAWLKSQQMDTMADFELAWTNLDRPSKAFTESRNPDGKREHPTQKPVSLMRWCLSFCPPGIVLDPFMGSGSTLVAAKETGRHAIGIEREEVYCEMAARRLAQDVLPFDAPQEAPETQADLLGVDDTK